MIAILSRVPLLLWAVIGVGIWGGYGHLQYTRLQSEWERYKLAQVELVLENQKSIRAAEVAKHAALQEVQNSYYAKAKEARNIASKLKSTNDKLQDALFTAEADRASSNPTTICGVNGERGKVLERLLGESAELVREGGERVAELSAKTTGLQRYIGEVCITPMSK